MFSMTACELNITQVLDKIGSHNSYGEDITCDVIDYQFDFLHQTIDRYFLENNYELLFDWFIELIKKEVELKKKLQEEQQDIINSSINLIISKLKNFHMSIIDMLIKEIHFSHRDYKYMSESSIFFACELKLLTFSMVNYFLYKLYENREINKSLFDNYISSIGQSLNAYCS